MALIALQGRPGSGKTTMASTMTKLGHHVHYIDMDHKLPSTEILKPLIHKNKISYVQCPHKLQTRSLARFAAGGIKDAYPQKKPEGYLWLCDMIDRLEKEPPDSSNSIVICIDSMSAVNRHLKQFMRYHAKAPKLGFDGWDAILQNYQSLIDALRMLTPDPYPHVIVTLHTRDDVIKEGEDSHVEARPFLDGQFRDEIASWFEEFYFLKVEPRGSSQAPKYVSYTVPVGEIQHARSSIIKTVKIDSDFAKIFTQGA